MIHSKETSSCLYLKLTSPRRGSSSKEVCALWGSYLYSSIVSLSTCSWPMQTQASCARVTGFIIYFCFQLLRKMGYPKRKTRFCRGFWLQFEEGFSVSHHWFFFFLNQNSATRVIWNILLLWFALQCKFIFKIVNSFIWCLKWIYMKLSFSDHNTLRFFIDCVMWTPSTKSY